MEQLHLLVEAVVMAFMIGGIVGALVALHLRSSREWNKQDAAIAVKTLPVESRAPHRRR